jgi:hypothetical protein
MHTTNRVASALAATALALTACGDATSTRPAADGAGQAARSAEPFVRNTLAVDDCLFDLGVFADPADEPAEADLPIAAWDAVEPTLPTPSLGAIVLEDSEIFLGFFADPQQAASAERAVAAPADGAGLAVSRFGNVLRIDGPEVQIEEAGAVEGCLSDNAATA